MKSVENGIDLGVGMLVIVLCLSTALFGLVKHNQSDLYNGLTDKNTVDVNGGLIASDEVDNKTVHELTLALVAAAHNRDNIRQLSIIVKPELSYAQDDYVIYEKSYSLIENYDDTKIAIETALSESTLDPNYGDKIEAGQYKSFVTCDQSNITCYILTQ